MSPDGQPAQPAVTYTNRKGVTYVLCRISTPNGRIRYVFARQPRGEGVDTLPTGYVIRESVNGVVSLASDRSPAFPDEELTVVERAVRRHPKASLYRVAARPGHIAIYERLGPEADAILAILGRTIRPVAGVRREVEETLEHAAQYAPVLRFHVVDPDTRTFGVERRWYTGKGEQWLPLATTGSLVEVVRAVVPVLGTEQFFELW